MFQPIIISLKIASLSTLIVLIIGLFLARICTKHDFKGRKILESLIIMPMVLPPSVIGFGLLKLIGRRGLIGSLLYNLFDVTLVFTWIAGVIAAVIVSLPLMYQSCKAALLHVDRKYEKAAKTLGADEKILFWRIILPLSWPGIVGGTVLAFARSLGEFGATLMVAGNIPGKTQTIPIAIYFAVESGNNSVANILVGVVVVFSFLVVYLLNNKMKSSFRD